MSRSIPDQLLALPLGEGAVLHGVRVVRSSLFGFQVEGARAVVDAREAAARIVARTSASKASAARIEVCFRCAGDGLGRRDRGVCAVCHGKGIQVVEPACGWSEAPPARVAAAVEQASSAFRTARHARARESLAEILATLAPLTGPRPLRRTEPPPAGGASAA